MLRTKNHTTVTKWMDGKTTVTFQKELPSLPRLTISDRKVSDLMLIACGAFHPLQGFMDRDDYNSVLERCRLAGGTVWPLPVVLGLSADDKKNLPVAGPVALYNRRGNAVGCLFLKKIYPRDLLREARLVYKTEDSKHPGVAQLFKEGEYLAGGEDSRLAP